MRNHTLICAAHRVGLAALEALSLIGMERLAAVDDRARLDRLVRLNRARTDFVEKLEALIESCNAGSRSIEELSEELLKLSKSLDDEQQRHVRENLTEEELTIFDILTRPAPELSTEASASRACSRDRRRAVRPRAERRSASPRNA